MISTSQITLPQLVDPVSWKHGSSSRLELTWFSSAVFSLSMSHRFRFHRERFSLQCFIQSIMLLSKWDFQWKSVECFLKRGLRDTALKECGMFPEERPKRHCLGQILAMDRFSLSASSPHPPHPQHPPHLHHTHPPTSSPPHPPTSTPGCPLGHYFLPHPLWIISTYIVNSERWPSKLANNAQYKDHLL